MQDKETTTTETKNALGHSSMQAKSAEILSEILPPSKDNSLKEKSHLESMLEDSTQRLYNLMHSQMEAQEKRYLSEDGNNSPMDEWQLKSVLDVSRELRETMKLRLDVARFKKEVIVDFTKAQRS